MLKSSFPFFYKPRYCNTLLRNIRIYFETERMIYSLGLPLEDLFHRNYSYHLGSGVFNYIFHQLDLKYSHTNVTNDVKKLSDFILCKCPGNDGGILKIGGKIEDLEKILSYLLSKGYTSKDIRERFLMYLKTCDIKDVSYDKLSLLEKIDSNILILLPLFSLPESILKLIAKNSNTDKLSMKEFPNRILYLSHHLELKPYELIPVLAKHAALLTMKFKRLDHKMNILKEANISSKYIVKDLWIFNYNELLLASRIKAAVKAGVELKPWMLRCSEKFFQSILIKYSETTRILDGKDIYCYLGAKLDCSPEYINYLMEKNKLLKSINIPKLEQVINFLYEKGYTPQEVRLFPRVFCSSIQTLERRFEELKGLKSTLPTIAQLCMAKKKSRSRVKEEI